MRFVLRAILIIACFLISGSEGEHSFQFVKQSVKLSTWIVDSTMENTVSESLCAAICVASHKCSAFVFEEGSCKMGSKSNTKPSTGNDESIMIFAKPMSYRILVVGGSTAEVIDMETSETTCAPFQGIRVAADGMVSGIGFNNQPFVCGGYDDITPYSYTCNWLSTSTVGWTEQTSALNYPRGWGALACNPYSETTFCVFAGGDGWHGQTAEILTVNGWKLVTSVMDEQIGFNCGTFFNETTAIIIAGSSNSVMLGKTYFFDTKTLLFSPGPPLLSKRYAHSCGRIHKNKNSEDFTVIVVGGENPVHVQTDLVEVFDYQQNTWKQGTPLPGKISGATMVTDPFGGVILIGGISSSGSNLKTIYRLANAETGTKWKLMDQQLKIARAYPTALIIPDVYTNCSLTPY